MVPGTAAVDFAGIPPGKLQRYVKACVPQFVGVEVTVGLIVLFGIAWQRDAIGLMLTIGRFLTVTVCEVTCGGEQEFDAVSVMV